MNYFFGVLVDDGNDRNRVGIVVRIFVFWCFIDVEDKVLYSFCECFGFFWIVVWLWIYGDIEVFGESKFSYSIFEYLWRYVDILESIEFGVVFVSLSLLYYCRVIYIVKVGWVVGFIILLVNSFLDWMLILVCVNLILLGWILLYLIKVIWVGWGVFFERVLLCLVWRKGSKLFFRGLLRWIVWKKMVLDDLIWLMIIFWVMRILVLVSFLSGCGCGDGMMWGW